MISIREMTAADEGAVMEMMDRFHHSPTMEHEVDPAALRRFFQVTVDPTEPLIQGLILEEDGRPVDYHYMCIGYSAEISGRYLLLDKLYLAPECRGKGYDGQMIRQAMKQHPEYTRYCLEVTGEDWATRLYERMGLRYLDYRQMVVDRQKGVFGTARMGETEALRAWTDVHYSYCQSILVPFADLCGLDKETAFRLRANFGSSMRHGPAYGAVAGTLMVLGLAGKGADGAATLMYRFRERSRVLDCANLLRLAKKRGEERRCHCDRMVYEAVGLLEELLGEEWGPPI